MVVSIFSLLFFLLLTSPLYGESGSTSTILLSQVPQESMTFLGNASFARTGGQIELSLPKFDDDDDSNSSSSSDGAPKGSSIGKALYNPPLQMLDPPSSFESTFSFAMSARSQGIAFVIVANNQDLDAAPSRHGLSVEFLPSGVIRVYAGGAAAAAAANASFNLSGAARDYAWIAYDSLTGALEVRSSNLSSRPDAPQIRAELNLGAVLNEFMFVGFAASAPLSQATRNTVFTWNFTHWPAAAPPPRAVVTRRGSSHPDPAEVPPSSASSRHHLGASLIAAAAVSAAAAALIAAALIALRRHRSPRKPSPFVRLGGRAGDPTWPLRRFSHKELAAATRNFGESEKLGARCYRASLGDQLAAVKLLCRDPNVVRASPGLAALTLPHHRNLARLIGYCSSETLGSLLVYDFVANGSLDRHLFAKAAPPLPWSHRHRIASGIAAALQSLHSHGLFHANLKPSNVLLDSAFNPIVGDFGALALGLGSGLGLGGAAGGGAAAAGMVVAGTFGYISPEAVQTGRPSAKADVFAFGAILLELACGRRALELRSEEDGGVVDVLVERVWEVFQQGLQLECIVDPKLGGLYDAAEMEVMIRLGLACSAVDAAARPAIAAVEKVLSGDVPPPMLEKEEAESKRPIEEVISMSDLTTIVASGSFNRLLS